MRRAGARGAGRAPEPAPPFVPRDACGPECMRVQGGLAMGRWAKAFGCSTVPLSAFLRVEIESFAPVSPRLNFSDRLDTCSFKRRSRCSSSAFSLNRKSVTNFAHRERAACCCASASGLAALQDSSRKPFIKRTSPTPWPRTSAATVPRTGSSCPWTLAQRAPEMRGKMG